MTIPSWLLRRTRIKGHTCEPSIKEMQRYIYLPFSIFLFFIFLSFSIFYLSIFLSIYLFINLYIYIYQLKHNNLLITFYSSIYTLYIYNYLSISTYLFIYLFLGYKAVSCNPEFSCHGSKTNQRTHWSNMAGSPAQTLQ